MTKPKARNLSLEKKTAARMAAVQCLYKGALMRRLDAPEKLIAEYGQHLNESRDDAGAEWVPDVTPHAGLLEEIVLGTCGNLPSIDGILKKGLKDSWSLERMNPVLVAIVRAATFELEKRETTPARTVVDEYVSIAGGFFDDPELGFVNALLHQLSGELRK